MATVVLGEVLAEQPPQPVFGQGGGDEAIPQQPLVVEIGL